MFGGIIDVCGVVRSGEIDGQLVVRARLWSERARCVGGAERCVHSAPSVRCMCGSAAHALFQLVHTVCASTTRVDLGQSPKCDTIARTLSAKYGDDERTVVN